MVLGSEGALVQLAMRFDDLEALEVEVQSNLGHGRAFVPGAPAVAERQRCELVLHHPETGDCLSFEAEAVWVNGGEPGSGVGLELADFDDSAAARLKQFVAAKPPAAGGRKPGDIYARVRRFTAAEQLRCAREGEFAERVVLEQIYGKAVWEVLLHNPRVTLPEVTRVARNPKVPRHLLDVITGNAGWLSNGALRRSLLKNRQLGTTALDKVLRATPRAELATMFRQPGFSPAVRQAIKKLIGR